MPVSVMSSTAKRFRWILALAIVATLGGCGTGAFEDSRRDAAYEKLVFIGRSTPDVASICYNSLVATPADVYALAKASCARTGRVPLLKGQTRWDCSLLYPVRADFRCVDPGMAPGALGM